MKKEHTPGPWTHCCDSSPRVKHMKTDCVISGHGQFVEEGNGVHRSLSVKVAKGISNEYDAVLIAAAPELLAACEYVEQFCKTAITKESAETLGKRLRSAIKTAKGRA